MLDILSWACTRLRPGVAPVSKETLCAGHPELGMHQVARSHGPCLNGNCVPDILSWACTRVRAAMAPVSKEAVCWTS